jgi:hypothetical protein
MGKQYGIAGIVPDPTIGDGKIDNPQEVYDFLRDIPEYEKLIQILELYATKVYVNEKVATDSATFRGTYNLVSDLQLTLAATESDIAAALASVISTSDNNDFSYVQIPTADDNPTEIARIDRYKFNGTVWAFEFSLFGSGFTASQWAAINSGITTALVTKLTVLPTAADIAAESAFQKNFATIVALSSDPNAGVTTVTTNPEWKVVYTDANDRILMGKRQDNTWYYATDLNDILDAIIDGYGS